PAVPAHATRFEDLDHVGDHLGVAAQHHLRGARRERDARGALEPLVADRSGNAARERTGMVLAADERDRAKLVGIARAHGCEPLVLGALPSPPDAVYEHPLLNPPPGMIGLEH